MFFDGLPVVGQYHPLQRSFANLWIGVEHALAELKTYKSVGSLWRHPRPLFSIGNMYMCRVSMQKKKKNGACCVVVYFFFRTDKFVPK